MTSRPAADHATNGMRRRRVSVAVVALVCAASSGLVACGRATPPSGAATGSRLPGAASRPATVAPATTQPAQWSSARQRAARQALSAQARAVVAGDIPAALSAVAPGAEQARQRSRLRRMVQVGISDLTLGSLVETVPPVPVTTEGVVSWDVEAAFDYRITGFDRSTRRFTLAVTLSGSPAQPARVAIVASRPADRPQPWDLGSLEIRRSSHSLVIAAGTAIDADEALRRADRAAARVEEVWGSAAPAVWVAPASTADAERLLGRSSGELTGLAAATDGPLEAGRPAGADRIVLSPDAWSSLRPIGRDVVMTHELTHVAVRASTTREVPLWLSEGLAEYVAYRSLDIPEKTVAAPLLTRVADRGLPADLPDTAQFGPGGEGAGAAYAGAWTVVLALVDRYGEAQVVRFYRAAAGGLPVAHADLGDPEAIVDAALRQVLGTSRSEVVQAWRQRLASLGR